MVLKRRKKPLRVSFLGGCETSREVLFMEGLQTPLEYKSREVSGHINLLCLPGFAPKSITQLHRRILFILVTSLNCCYGNQCAIASGYRELCMYETVSQTVCENEGCCYDAVKSPNCYYSKAEGKGIGMFFMLYLLRYLASDGDFV